MAIYIVETGKVKPYTIGETISDNIVASALEGSIDIMIAVPHRDMVDKRLRRQAKMVSPQQLDLSDLLKWLTKDDT